MLITVSYGFAYCKNKATFYTLGLFYGVSFGILIGSTLISSIDYKGMYLVEGIINILAFIIFVGYERHNYRRNKRDVFTDKMD